MLDLQNEISLQAVNVPNISVDACYASTSTLYYQGSLEAVG